jgi:type I restriction enzyme R subunit
MNEAFIQLLRYQSRRGEKEGNEKLFWYNLLMVITSSQQARFGTITSGYEHFVEWKDPYPYCLSDINEDKNISNQQVLIQGMFSRKNLLEILHIFSLFKKSSDGGIYQNNCQISAIQDSKKDY